MSLTGNPGASFPQKKIKFVIGGDATSHCVVGLETIITLTNDISILTCEAYYTPQAATTT